MAEQLPQPNVIIPQERDTLRLMLEDQRLEWLGALVSAGRGGYDGQRQDRQARANMDHLLDHYPAGTPRDHLVMYATIKVPESVVLGVD